MRVLESRLLSMIGHDYEGASHRLAAAYVGEQSSEHIIIFSFNSSSLLLPVDEQKLEERFRINRRELVPLEFPVLVALEMGLYLPESMVMPHYRRLVQQG